MAEESTAAMRDTAVFPPMVYNLVGIGEETGALDFTLKPICWYQLHFNDGGRGSFSLLCAADVRTMGALQSEIAEVRTFDEMPSALTYPKIQPFLLAEAIRRGMA